MIHFFVAQESNLWRASPILKKMDQMVDEMDRFLYYIASIPR
jgi:hypothetical protein